MDDQFLDLSLKLGLHTVTSQSTVTPEAVRQFEQDAGIRLPDDYRRFLQHHGMSTVPGLVFPDPNQPDQPGGGVEVFFGLQSTGDFDLLVEWEDMQTRLPDLWLPVATSPGGTICLSLSDDDPGNIWWISETAKEPDLKGHRIADSFTTFLGSLTIHD